jgi:arylsulfatase A-like enzyme
MKEVRRLLTREKPDLNEKYVYAETLYPGQVPKGPNQGKQSLAKIMVRNGRYKYIYNPFGIMGHDNGPTEELYDIEYDPAEKINFVAGMTSTHDDIGHPNKHGKPSRHVLTRCGETLETLKSAQDGPSKGFFKNGSFAGWADMYHRLLDLRARARNVWKATGRVKYFKVPEIK